MPACNWANMVLRGGAASLDIAVFDPERCPVRVEMSLEELSNVAEARVSCRHDLNMTLLLERSAKHEKLPLL